MIRKCKICGVAPKQQSVFESAYNNGTHKLWCPVCKSEIISKKSLCNAKILWNKANKKNSTG